MASLRFIQQPGSRERHLQRRYQNPLFPEQQQQVTPLDLDVARKHDSDEVTHFGGELRTLLVDVSQFSGHEETDKVLAVKESADRLYEQCIGLAGDHERERQGLLKLNEVIMAAIANAAGQDALAIEELAREVQAREIHLQMLSIPLIADILRQDAAIQADDLLPSIMSADIETIKTALSLFDPEQTELLKQQAIGLQQSLQAANAYSDDIASKFQVLLLS